MGFDRRRHHGSGARRGRAARPRPRQRRRRSRRASCRIANSGEPDTLDPHHVSGVWENRIIGDMLMGLTTEAADGSVIPGAAESWEVSDDGTVYTFTLRDHSWSDGTPVTADDFVFALQRILDPAEAAEYASLLYTIKNAKALNEGAIEGMEQLGVQALDPKTLEITLESPTPYFVEQLTHYTAFPVPKHKVEELGDDWIKPGNIVGNGAYTVVEWLPNTPHQGWSRTTRSTTPTTSSIDSVTYYPAEERNAATKRFRAGEIDIQYDFASEQIDWLKENLPEETRISPWLGIYYYAFNTRKPPFDNKAVRQALAHGDRSRGDHRQGPAHGRAAGLQLRAARHRQLRRAVLRRLEGHALPGARRQGQGADGRGGLRPGQSAQARSCATTPRRTTRRSRSRSPRCGSSSASRPSCSTPRSRSTTTTCRRAISRSRAPAGSPTTTTRRTSST